jgi:DNA (cytosine-5)-methyltransferase 1
VEYDPVHAATHQFNFPLTEVLCRKIEDVTAEDVREAAQYGRRRHGHSRDWDGRIDLVAGGPPCQGFSLIGKRLLDDPRNQLVFHFFRLIIELRPRYFVMENVPGMAIGGQSGILDALLSEFRQAGYQVRDWQVLKATEFGVPQARRRLFVIGADANEPVPSAPSAIGDCPTVGDAINDLPDVDEFPELLETDEVLLPPRLIEAGRRRASVYARRLRGIKRDEFDFSHPRRWDPSFLTSSMRTRHTDESISRFASTPPGAVEPTSRFLRLDPAGVANTLRAGTGSERGAYTSPRPIHPAAARVITVREAARLHSFPDWFRFHRTKWHGFRQVGNAVAPLVGRAVAGTVVDALGVTPVRPSRVRLLGSSELLELNMREAADHFGVSVADAPAPRRRALTVAA